MLSLPAAPISSTGGSNRHHYLSRKGDAWRPHASVMYTASLAKRQQLFAVKHPQIPVSTSMLKAAQQSHEDPRDSSSFLQPTGPVPFRLMAFSDSSDEDSDYMPSDEEDEEEYDVEEREEEDHAMLGNRSIWHEKKHMNKAFMSREQVKEGELLCENKSWNADKGHRWTKGFSKPTKCMLPKRFHHFKSRNQSTKKEGLHRSYKFVLAGVVLVNLVQLILVYSVSSWAFSMVAWQPLHSENDALDSAVAISASTILNDTVLKEKLPYQVPDHVRTGLYLCSTLSRRLVQSDRDVMATQHALRACDLAVKFAPQGSQEAIEALVVRGDLRSLLSLFDNAMEDYNAAVKLVQKAQELDNKRSFALGLLQQLELKLVANRWTQLYLKREFKDLRREAKTGISNSNTDVKELAHDWLNAFKRKKPVLDALIRQRGWTLRRLNVALRQDFVQLPLIPALDLAAGHEPPGMNIDHSQIQAYLG
ncbi:hypothetical protein CCR75_003823 [Bremia lactucae]|uniref:Uncharacterized protein n=1 Tax=Bremia lactucae TaxID=4779 RepID=A0A976FJN9_BRELC|nr:hypothetical protein CCR75_003823 [Bremia lactucae]